MDTQVNFLRFFKAFWKLNYTEPSTLYTGFDSRGRYREKESPAITNPPTCGEEIDNPVLAQVSTSHPSTMVRGTKESLCNGEVHVKMDLFLALWAPSSPTLDGQTDELVMVCCEKLCLFLSFGEGRLSNALSPPYPGCRLVGCSIV